MQEESSEIQNLRTQVMSLEEKNQRLASSLVSARERIHEMGEQLIALSRPPASYATFLSAREFDNTVTALINGRKMNLAVTSSISLSTLKPGQELRVNEQMVVIGVEGYETTGQIVRVELVIDSQRVLVKLHSEDSRVLRIGGKLRGEKIRVGDTLLADLKTGFVTEKVARPDIEHLLLEETPKVDWGDIGGLAAQITQIHDSVELPFTHPELYRRYGLKPPKGVLLYGPPGCGKTMIAKAIATSLANRSENNSSRESGAEKTHENTAYFLNIKGPQLLDKYVGETERQIREIFSRARDRARAGIPVVIFFDEMEALFRTRGSGISSDVETTVVPQLLAEIDGVEKLDNVIVIGASNREDMIDPALLRSGRLDVKIRIERPNRDGAKEILRTYVRENLPFDPASFAPGSSEQDKIHELIEAATHEIFAEKDENEYIRATYADGHTRTLMAGDFLSGAMLASIVDRTKKIAIKEELAGRARGITCDHIRQGVREEITQMRALTPIDDAREWAKVNGWNPHGTLVAIHPVLQEAPEN